MSFLKENFFTRETTQVAVNLLGCYLVRTYNKKFFLKGKIVEVEAYLGERDDCCHTYQGRRTERNQVMYDIGGTIYVYFTYGMHFCFNIVTSQKNIPEAVLIRAIEPLEGISKMKACYWPLRFYLKDNQYVSRK